MEPIVQRWSNVQDFLAAAGDFLAAREAEHCLLIGIASTIAHHPEVYDNPLFWTIHEAGRVVAAALRTPPHNVLMSQFDEPRWLSALITDVLATDQPPGVIGPTAAARALADAWSAHTGRATECVMQQRIFRLDRLIPPRAAPGHWREAEDRDRAVLTDWLAAFHDEAAHGAPPLDAAEMADRFLRRVGRVAHLWEHAGTPVALTGSGGPTPHGIRIGPVYTPPSLRGRGYASNLVAAVTRHELASGRTFCFLFTDLANPTSNHIYEALGYRPVVDVDQYSFSA